MTALQITGALMLLGLLLFAGLNANYKLHRRAQEERNTAIVELNECREALAAARAGRG